MKTTDENLISAFIEGTTAADIMKKAGISRTRYYRLVRDPDFRLAVTKRRAEIVDTAVKKMELNLSHNVMMLQMVIDDPETAPQTRVNAISVMMSQMTAWKSISDFESRLIELEEFRNEQK